MIRVVLPAPFDPNKHVMHPLYRLEVKLESTVTPTPAVTYVLLMLRIAMTVSASCSLAASMFKALSCSTGRDVYAV